MSVFVCLFVESQVDDCGAFVPLCLSPGRAGTSAGRRFVISYLSILICHFQAHFIDGIPKTIHAQMERGWSKVGSGCPV